MESFHFTRDQGNPFPKNHNLFSFNTKLIICISLFFLLTKIGFAQIDIRKYATNDLFKVNPVIDLGNIKNINKNIETDIVEAEIQKGLDLLNTGEIEEALDHFERMQEEFTPVAYFPYMIGSIHYNQGHFEEAIVKFEEALSIDRLFMHATYMIGLSELEMDNLKSAGDHFEQLINVLPFQSYGYYGLAQLAMKQNDMYKAIKNYKNCIQSDSKFLDAYIPIIVYHLYYDRLTHARKTVEQGLRTDNNWQEGIMIRGVISLLQDKNTDQFEKDVDKLISIDPSNYHYYSIKGFLNIELGKFNDAVKFFHQAHNLEVDSVHVGSFKFNSRLSRKEENHKALNYYFDNYAMEPDCRKYLDIAICKLMSSDKENALIFLDSANMISENAVTSTFEAIIYNSQHNKKQESIEAFTRTINLDSTNWIAYNYRGRLLFEMDSLQKAYEDFTHVIQLKPRIKDGYKNRGQILMISKNYQKAYRDYSFAISIDPTDNDIYFNRAYAAYNLNQYLSAISDLDRILIDENDGDAFYLKHKCTFHLQDTLASLQLLDSASKYSKYTIQYHKELIDLALHQSKPGMALNGHNRLVKYFPYRNEFLLQRAKYYYDINEYDLAQKDLLKYTKTVLKSGEAYHYLGMTYIMKGEEKEGSKFLTKAKKLNYVNE